MTIKNSKIVDKKIAVISKPFYFPNLNFAIKKNTNTGRFCHTKYLNKMHKNKCLHVAKSNKKY